MRLHNLGFSYAWIAREIRCSKELVAVIIRKQRGEPYSGDQYDA